MNWLRFLSLLFGLWQSSGLACLPTISSSINKMATTSGDVKCLYDFRKIATLDAWHESSDTVRTQGMSKGAFVLQKTKMFQRAVFFSLLNQQPNGAAFVGFYTYDNWDLAEFSALRLKVRGQGQNRIWKVMFKHRGNKIDDGSVSYQAFFEVPLGEWTIIIVPFDSFQAYYRGAKQPDAEPLALAQISLVGLQIVGGVYSSFKQSGPSSLEIDYIEAI